MLPKKKSRDRGHKNSRASPNCIMFVLKSNKRMRQQFTLREMQPGFGRVLYC